MQLTVYSIEVVEITNEICSLAGHLSSPSSTGSSETNSVSLDIGCSTPTQSGQATATEKATKNPNVGNKLNAGGVIVCFAGLVFVAIAP